MKIVLVLSVITGLLIFSCGEKEDKNLMDHDFSKEMTTKQHIAKIVERIDAGSYSYLNVSENGGNYWIAIPLSDLQPGEEITFSKYMQMNDFRSETLDRTFKSVLFVEDAIRSNDTRVANPHQMQLSSIPKENVKIEKVKDGYTIAELYANKNELNNKIVLVRGKVVKANLGIMNRNWFHIQDGTGKDGTHDITIISNDEVKLGDQVLVEGTLVKDRDFGSGYVYSLVLENSSITKE